MKKKRPKVQEVAFRLMAIKFPIVWALTAPPRDKLDELMVRWPDADRSKFVLDLAARRDKTISYLRESGLWRSMSTKEQTMMETTPLSMTKQQHIDASWSMEGAAVLMWTLSLLDELPPYGTLSNPELLKQIPSVDLDTFARSATLQPVEQIDRARNVAEFWHWRSRTRELIERGDTFSSTDATRTRGINSYDDIVRLSARQGFTNGDLPPCVDDDFAVDGKAYRDLSESDWSRVRSQTIERHRAFNWLCGYSKGNDWDKTPTET